MTTKPKTRKAPAAKGGTPRPDVRDKLREAHREMWNAQRCLKLIELAAKAAIYDRDNAEDYSHAIGTATRNAAERIQAAYDLIDEAQFDAMEGVGA